MGRRRRRGEQNVVVIIYDGRPIIGNGITETAAINIIGVISVFVIGPKMTIFGGAIFGGVFCGLCGSITTTAATGLGQALEGGNCDLQVPRTRVWGTSSARPRDQKLASLSG